MPESQNSDGRIAPWTALVITLFPELFPGPLCASLAGQALRAGRWALETVPIREFGLGAHNSVDDAPAGGGPGMVMRADVLGPAIDHARSILSDTPLIYLSPRGAPLRQPMVRELSSEKGVILLAGRFEGIDERVIEKYDMREVSIGDYVLSGGEIAAMAVIDACVRLLPGVVGEQMSTVDESFEQGLLEYPQYTRPREWEGLEIPEILLSGNHRKIAEWRRRQSEELTRQRRPDLQISGTKTRSKA